MAEIDCPECKLRMMDDVSQCPHCGRPYFPNVNAAARPEEVWRLWIFAVSPQGAGLA